MRKPGSIWEQKSTFFFNSPRMILSCILSGMMFSCILWGMMFSVYYQVWWFPAYSVLSGTMISCILSGMMFSFILSGVMISYILSGMMFSCILSGMTDKCATGVKLREDITIAISNVRTLRAAGKLDNFCMRWTDTSGASLDCMRWDRKSLEKSQQSGVTECISSEKRTNMNKEWVS